LIDFLKPTDSILIE